MLESGKRFAEEFIKQISKDENMRMLSLQIRYIVFLVMIAGLLITIILLKRAINNLKNEILKNRYEKTTYYKQTRVPYHEIMNQNNEVSKGRRGEYLISLELNEFEKKGAKLLFNCYLPKEESQFGEFSEVDVMLIHSTGIYVIESKNYRGGIEGSVAERNWYQSICRYVGIGKKQKKLWDKYPFYNPILQNKTHIENLKRVIKEKGVQKDIPIYSLVVFSNGSILRNYVKKKNGKNKLSNGIKIKNTRELRVINTQYVYSTVKQMGRHSKGALSQEDIKQLKELLYPYTQKTESEIFRHRNGIQRIKRNMYPKRICPKCGMELVVRFAQKGQNRGKNFYGCKRFPQCRYTENIR